MRGTRSCRATEHPGTRRHGQLRRLGVIASGLAAAVSLAGCALGGDPGQGPTRITVPATTYHWPPVHTPPPGGEKLTRSAVRTELGALLDDSGVGQVSEPLPERAKPCGVLLLGLYPAKTGEAVSDKVFTALVRQGWRDENGQDRAGETRWYFKGSWSLTASVQPMVPVGQVGPGGDVMSISLSADYPCGSPSPSTSR